MKTTDAGCVCDGSVNRLQAGKKTSAGAPGAAAASAHGLVRLPAKAAARGPRTAAEAREGDALRHAVHSEGDRAAVDALRGAAALLDAIRLALQLHQLLRPSLRRQPRGQVLSAHGARMQRTCSAAGPAPLTQMYMPTTSPSLLGPPYGSRFASWIFSPPAVR